MIGRWWRPEDECRRWQALATELQPKKKPGQREPCEWLCCAPAAKPQGLTSLAAACGGGAMQSSACCGVGDQLPAIAAISCCSSFHARRVAGNYFYFFYFSEYQNLNHSDLKSLIWKNKTEGKTNCRSSAITLDLKTRSKRTRKMPLKSKNTRFKKPEKPIKKYGENLSSVLWRK